MTKSTDRCSHADVSCLNEYDFIRKYRCGACGAVMMCGCDEQIGQIFLPHQLKVGQEYGTRNRVPVTAGFQPHICRDCRSLPPEPHPRAEIRGQTSKIRRYYWREIDRLRFELLLPWARAHGWEPGPPGSPQAQAAWDNAEEQALADIKKLHETSPKYVYDEESDEDIIRRCGVEVLSLPATYARVSETKRVQVLDGNARISVEEYAIRHFARHGWQALVLESRPFHALFGTMMWGLIQDESDEELQTVATGDVRDFEANRKGERIWFRHPRDFGSAAYGKRRAAAIDDHLSNGTGDREALLRRFDEGVEQSWSLRNYLWAHLEEDVRAARRVVELLPPSTTVVILRYLVEDYWHHYLGWPDLLIWKAEEYQLVEVKSSKDKLSEDQKRWVSDNFDRIHLPFRIVKVHKTAVVD